MLMLFGDEVSSHIKTQGRDFNQSSAYVLISRHAVAVMHSGR